MDTGIQPAGYDSIITFLEGTLPFSDLDRPSLIRIARHCLVDFFPAGTRILRRGVTEVDGLYLIQKGAIRLFHEDEGVLVDIRTDGASLGALSLFNGEKAALDAETVEDTFVIKIPRERFFEATHLNPSISRFYLKSFADTFLSKAFEEMRCKPAAQHEDHDLHVFSNPVGGLISREPVSVPFGLSIQAAAREMIRQNTGSLLFREPSGEICGIITDTDLRKAMALGLDLQAPAETIMSTPVESVDASAVCFDALLTMMSRNIHHLVVRSHGKVQGVVSSHDIMLLQGRSPMSVFREIASRTTIAGLYPLHDSITPVIRTLVQQGAKAGNITRMIAILNDQIISRLLELMLGELGPPPVRFCLLLMGSEGRREQTFATDQDNALIIDNCGVDFLERAAETYFSAFTERMVGHLINCGFPRCPGDMMASNPAWRGTLNTWKGRVETWVAAPEPQRVLASSVFFDFRGVYGHKDLSENLRQHVTSACAGKDLFLRYLAADCLNARPPLTFFKNFMVEKDGAHRNTLDIKARGLLPFMDFARVMALYHGIRETGTLTRLDLLHQAGHLSRDLYHEAREAFEFLLHARLMHQLEQMEAGKKPDNRIDPASLSALEKRTLREAFGVISALHGVLRETFRLNMG
ncbi:MAG: cyclic nucleotide-binding/CBS domain-containing protein [Desulfovibrionales bacterium]|nr:cyclic nucleotide-binding/CBS domain-containing protein [Desulfovibrionales bacterium]